MDIKKKPFKTVKLRDRMDPTYFALINLCREIPGTKNRRVKLKKFSARLHTRTAYRDYGILFFDDAIAYTAFMLRWG